MLHFELERADFKMTRLGIKIDKAEKRGQTVVNKEVLKTKYSECTKIGTGHALEFLSLFKKAPNFNNKPSNEIAKIASPQP